MNQNKRNFNRGNWRDLLDKVHVYGGLFIALYLIIIGLSSLQFQHHFNLPEGNTGKTWWQQINMPVIEDNREYKLAVRDSLGLFGYTPWWQDYTDKKGIHHFKITRPGKSYWVEVQPESKLYRVNESRDIIGAVLALHGLTGGALEGPAFIKVWKFFAQIMNVVFLIVISITLYFWYERSFQSFKGWILAGTIAFISILALLFIWLVG